MPSANVELQQNLSVEDSLAERHRSLTACCIDVDESLIMVFHVTCKYTEIFQFQLAEFLPECCPRCKKHQADHLEDQRT